VSFQKTIVDVYMEGFRRGDHGAILDCLTDDVTWLIAGYTTKRGKESFDSEIVNDDFEGLPTLAVNRVVEEGDTVVAIGEGRATHRTNGEFRFAFSDVFVFRGKLIERVESYITPLGGESPAA
jgi:uncharacterized protein